MKETRQYYSGGGGGSVNFTGAKKLSADSEEINTIFTSSVVKALKTNKKPKDKATDESELQDESEKFKIKKLDIGSKSNL